MAWSSAAGTSDDGGEFCPAGAESEWRGDAPRDDCVVVDDETELSDEERESSGAGDVGDSSAVASQPFCDAHCSCCETRRLLAGGKLSCGASSGGGGIAVSIV